ncbi:glycosyltransferase family 2 protein [Flavihumibacter rivuli]|uniref:glycosyltransferase family 2 protein n=1 Tax=Flavihumibacter rivuli TaxID=2838156 RepID=UPI001BDEF262|nr:glycosyltransferase family 2 protein [Flavihumibacter rivuli]ULQ58295.1 glycosyltransferase family 2 protein [Flavihumibacter rivuli]
MTGFLQYVFWASMLVVGYTYIGYGLLLFLLTRGRERSAAVPEKDEDLLPVTVVICAFNEAEWISGKIKNTLGQDYPAGKMKLLVVTDGSTDGTNTIAASFEGVDVLHDSSRLGKANAINRAMAHASDPVVVFTDANTFLPANCLRNLLAPYADPSVGGVAGEKRVGLPGSTVAVAKGEGMYWKYESFLKTLDDRLYTVVGAAGELFSIRRDCFRPLEPDTILEDFVLSLRICLAGKKVAYVPEAYAIESGSASFGEERKRKVRIAAGGFQAMGRLLPLMAFWKHPVLSFQYISHRVLRWTLAPVSLFLIFASNLLLWVFYGGFFWGIALAAQLVFYALAYLGSRQAGKGNTGGAWMVPYYFVFMNSAVVAGFWLYINGKSSANWEKSGRLPLTGNRQS